MCKFFMLDIFEYLKPYKYYMRCDTDCFVNNFGHDSNFKKNHHKILF